MRLRYGLLVIALLTMLAFAGCAAAPAAIGSENLVVRLDEGQDRDSVSVTAKGTVKVTPDVAYTTVGVVTQHKKMQKAQDANRERMNAVAEALKAKGLTDDDIQTVNYSVYPAYKYSEGKQRIDSFEVNNTIELTIRDIEKTGEILDAAAAAGANISYSVRFDILEKDPAYRSALSVAMESARAKADTISKAGGFTIKGVMNVSEGYTDNTVYFDYPLEEAAEPGMERAPTYIKMGDLDITATVTVEFEIE